jgi:hypothetical protein
VLALAGGFEVPTGGSALSGEVRPGPTIRPTSIYSPKLDFKNSFVSLTSR